MHLLRYSLSLSRILPLRGLIRLLYGLLCYHQQGVTYARHFSSHKKFKVSFEILWLRAEKVKSYHRTCGPFMMPLMVLNLFPVVTHQNVEKSEENSTPNICHHI